jgi:protein-S-isoprenylcysteine O-methyltransferase Ste14
MRSNKFAASNIQVEEGQKVISTGPYVAVRHPMYAGALAFLAGIPLVFGSLWTMLMTPVFFLVFAVRIRDEEKVLVRDLTSYTEYEKRVCWRLFPGIF